jgi:hypothetical protein
MGGRLPAAAHTRKKFAESRRVPVFSWLIWSYLTAMVNPCFRKGRRQLKRYFSYIIGRRAQETKYKGQESPIPSDNSTLALMPARSGSKRHIWDQQ